MTTLKDMLHDFQSDTITIEHKENLTPDEKQEELDICTDQLITWIYVRLLGGEA